jgi:hypothetical protein
MRTPQHDLQPALQDHGQTQAEYALLMAGIFLLAAATLLLVGPPIGQLYQAVIDALA